MSESTKYYNAGSNRFAMRQTGVVTYLFGDQLGSTSVAYNDAADTTRRQGYTAFGTERYNLGGDLPTRYQFTGQRGFEEIGLQYYGARWYDGYLNRFLSPDSIVPDQFNPLDWDRYSYTRNNPLRFADPTGHRPDELGCEVDGCYTEQDLRDIAYFEARQFYVSCQNGGGSGCPNYGEIAAFTIGGLVGAAALPEVVSGIVGFGSKAAPVACADGDCTNEAGKLISTGKNVWQSTKGLIYGADPVFGNRVIHVLRHTLDDASRNVHGVFTVGRANVLAVIDNAWAAIQSGSNSVLNVAQQGSTTTYIVDMGVKIGYIGGKFGLANGYPTTTLIRIITVGNNIISAYPVNGYTP